MKHSVGALLFIFLLRLSAQDGQFVGAGYFSSLYLFSEDIGVEEQIIFRRPQQSEQSKVVELNDKIWGLIVREGANGSGILFSMNLDGSGYQTIYEFKEDQVINYGWLRAINGELWGTTDSEVFKFNPTSLEISFLGDFSEINGGPQNGIIALDGNTILGNGVDSGSGFIYKMNKDGSNLERIHSFTGTDGQLPFGNLVASNGHIYGSCILGGAMGGGSVYRISMADLSFELIHSFGFSSPTAFNIPIAGLTVGEGRIWGSAQGIFSFDLDGGDYEEHYFFESGSTGAVRGYNPNGLTIENNEVWGTCSLGGLNGLGTVFKMDITNDAVTELHNFGALGSTDGRSPRSSMCLIADKFWSFTGDGGQFGNGVLFSITPEGQYSVERDLADIDSLGYQVRPRLIEVDGRLWGTTSGGSLGYGTIFSVNKDLSNFHKAHDFDYLNGSFPNDGLIFHDEKLWGFARDVIYSLNPTSLEYRVEKDVDVLAISGRLISVGNTLYGAGYESIFAYDPEDQSLTIVYSILNSSIEGIDMTGYFLQDGSKIWGLTRFGGADSGGTIFSYDTSNGQYEVAHSFENAIGRPLGGLIAHDGLFWGSGSEFIYSIDPSNNQFQSYQNLNSEQIGTSTANSQIELVSHQGFLWGTTSSGAGSNNGSVFKFDPSTGMATKVLDLSFSDDVLSGGLFPIINTPPVLTGTNQSLLVDEDGSFNFDVEQLIIDDPDSYLTPSYQLIIQEGENYTIDGNTIVPSTDYSGQLTIPIIVNDGVNDSEAVSVLLEVVPVNDAPVILATISPTIEEGSSYSIRVDDLTISDPDNDPKDFTIIVEDGLNYSFEGTQVFPVADFFGELLVNVRASDGKDQSELFQFPILVDQVLGTHEAGVQLYPNPTEDVIYISEVADMKAFQLFNASGFEIRNLEPTANELDLSELSDGVYFLRITLRNGSSIMRKIIKK